MYYAITAQVHTYEQADNARVWRGARSLPTFYLSADVQGITDERHAVQIARTIIDPFSALNTTVTAVQIP